MCSECGEYIISVAGHYLPYLYILTISSGDNLKVTQAVSTGYYLANKKDMAILHSTSPIHGISGTMGGLLFRQINGKTIVSVKPSAPRKQSEVQKQNRDKFKRAACWAQYILRTKPERKSYYQNIARKLNLPNAYTAAICEYMRKAKPKVASRSSFVASKNNAIRIEVSKPGFKIRRIKVLVSNAQDIPLTEQIITQYDRQKQFHFKIQDDLPDATSITILTDEPGHNIYNIPISDILLIKD